MEICKICKQNIDNRTNRQNAYLHVCFKIIGDATGYSMREIKALLKYEFGYYNEVLNKKTGEVLLDFISTADLSKKEFADFTEKVLHFAYKNNIVLETPEEYFRRISEIKQNEFINSSQNLVK